MRIRPGARMKDPKDDQDDDQEVLEQVLKILAEPPKVIPQLQEAFRRVKELNKK